MYLPIWLHRSLLLLSQTLFGALAFFGAALLMMPLIEILSSLTLFKQWPWLMLLLMLLPLVLARTAFWVIRSIFWNLIPARCSECGGQAWCCGESTVLYECSRCGYLHETRWDELERDSSSL